MINVINRDGIVEPLDLNKIQKKTARAVKGLDNVSQVELDEGILQQLQNNITTSQIQECAIKTALDKIDIDKPNWTFVAARMFLYDLYHRVGKVLNTDKGSPYGNLSKYLEYGEAKGKIIKGFHKKFNIDFLNKQIVGERDMLFTYLGIKTLYDRYILKNEQGEPIELPQYLFMGVAMFLALNENVNSYGFYKKYANLFNNFKPENKYEEKLYGDFGKILPQLPIPSSFEDDIEARSYMALLFYTAISNFFVMVATPTLSNARTPRHQLSSCYVGSTPDNIEGIFDAYREMAMLSKFGGGIGWDWSKIRAMSSSIDNNKGAGGGVIPFLKITNDVAIAVDQLGTRKGAIAVYLETWHLDIRDFLDLKKNSGEERRRTHDLFPALWISDLFMKRVENDEKWTLFDPLEVPELTELYGEEFEKKYIEYEKRDDIRQEVVSAKALWKEVLRNYFETGNPFLGWKDNANKANPNSHAGIIRSSNLCTEIFQNTEPKKILVKLNTENNQVFYFKEEEEIETIEGEIKQAKKVTAIDTIIVDGKQYKINFVEKTLNGGDTAVCNLASINLSKVNTKERIKTIVPIAVRMLDNVIDLNFYPDKKAKHTNLQNRAIGLGIMGEAQMLAESKIVWGSQEHLYKIDEIMEAVSYYAILSSSNIASEKGSYPLYKNSKWSNGIFQIDEALKNNEVTNLVNRDLSFDWNNLREKVKKDGMRNGYLMAIAPTSSISILTGTTQTIEPVFKKKWYEVNLSGEIPVVVPNLDAETWNYYTSAYDINQVDIIKAAAVRQKWIDQGQSLNIFMRLDKANGRYLNEIYNTAWKLGLKSTYYLRSQSPEALQEEIVEDRSMECVGCQ